jgi:hypothetical protein
MFYSINNSEFKVSVVKNHISLFQQRNQNDPEIMVCEWRDYSHVFIGMDEGNEGNTILIQLNPLNYVYIGIGVFSFKTTYPIVKYVSKIGGSGGYPYPYAIDTQQSYYLMLDMVKIKHMKTRDPSYHEDPYYWYYEHNRTLHGYYEPNAAKQYKKLTADEKAKVNKPDYIHEMKSFGKRMGFSAIRSRVLF